MLQYLAGLPRALKGAARRLALALLRAYYGPLPDDGTGRTDPDTGGPGDLPCPTSPTRPAAPVPTATR
ncbi:MAG: hypothetical protein JWL97_3507 [Gemmatimonadales bacterium]|nr:hypothetical protein [Gemmatimonadales bacterium]